MDGQLVIAGLIVAFAAGYVLRAVWRTVRGAKVGCGSGCGKCAPAETPKAGRVSLPQV